MRFVVIMSDTFRYDNLTTLPTRTPELDAFARTAAFFTRAYHASFPTIPNRYDLATGRYAFPFRGWAPLDPDDTTLAEVLSGEGHITQLLADTPHLMKHEYNYSRGFRAFDWMRGQEGDLPMTWMDHPIVQRTPHRTTRMKPLFQGEPLANLSGWTNRRWDGEEDIFCAQTCRRACEWLEHNHTCENFLLWLDLFDPHEPWDPPEYFVRRYQPEYDGERMLHCNYGPASDYAPAELRNLQAHYMAEAELVSKHVGRVLRKLEEVGIEEDTVVVFTADHGTLLGEHNRTGKTNICHHDDRGPWPLYEQIAHVPLIIRIPGMKKGRRLGQFAEPVDLMPTLLDLAGITKTPPTHGHSLLPLLKGRKVTWPRSFNVASQGLEAHENTNWTTVRTASWCLYVGGRAKDKPQLFDLRKDPGEKKNVFTKNRNVAKRLAGLLARRLESVGTDPAKIENLTRRV